MADYQSIAPTTTPVTLSDAKAHLNVSHNDDDTLITALINSATVTLEARCNRCFVNQTRVLTMRTFDDSRYVRNRRIYPPRSPVSSVSSITYVDSAGTTTTLPSSEYIAGTNGKPGYISEAYNETWPGTRVEDDNVTVTYVAGHSSSSTGVPANIQLAINQLVSHWYRNRENVGKVGGDIAWTVDALLESEHIEQYG